MSERQGFFGSIFDSPDDDPLLQSDDESPRSAREDRDAAPSWMSDEDFMRDGADPNETNVDDVPVEMQEIVVRDAADENAPGIRTLNQAIEHGWRLSQIELDRSPHASSRSGRTQFIVTIERDIPRSLFDFGPGG